MLTNLFDENEKVKVRFGHDDNNGFVILIQT